MKRNRQWVGLGLGVALALLMLGTGSVARAAAASAELQPPRIALDEAATLRVATDGGRSPALPAVDGLRFQPSGQSSEMTVINGAVSQHTFQLYQVVASRPGSFAIPVGGQTLRLEVAPAGRAPAAGNRQRGGVSEPDAPDARSPVALLRVAWPKRSLYVGQAVPVTLKAYFRPGTEVTLTGPPSLTNAAFTLSQLSTEPRQSVEAVGGVPYRVATWTGVATAALSGSQSAEVSLPIVARYREASRRAASDPFAGLADDDLTSSALLRSFMSRSPFGVDADDLFAPVREREMTLRSTPQMIDVQPLPAGAPAGFSGAVGQFDLRATLQPSAGVAFEPMTLQLAVSGKGSFDRVALAGLPASSRWKSYPPRAVPPPANGAPVAGKVFEQAVVPQTSGDVALPPIAFSFFDPDQRRYVTRSTAALTVAVAPATGDATAPPVAAADDRAAGAGTPSPVARSTTPHFVATLTPPTRQAWFWLLLALPLLAVAALAASRRPRRPSARAQRRRRRGRLVAQRAALHEAAQAQDPPRFFAAAQTALQERLGARWGVAPAEVTAAEVERRLGEPARPIVATLSMAEQIRYAGRLPPAATLPKYEALIARELEQLEERP